MRVGLQVEVHAPVGRRAELLVAEEVAKRLDPLAVPEFIQEMKRRGHPESIIRKLVFENPLAFFRQCARWQEWPTEEDAKRKTSKERGVATY